jgi:hypothetical protein
VRDKSIRRSRVFVLAVACLALAGALLIPVSGEMRAEPLRSAESGTESTDRSPASGATSSRRHAATGTRWTSRALGLPWAGRLVGGVRLPVEGVDFFTWDPILRRSPNRWWRRYGTARLVRVVTRVAHAHRLAHPEAPRMAVGDLSRPRGGEFGPRFGPPGHASHQNGLDVDVYLPRDDRLERGPRRPAQVDRRLAQDLVNRFVAAGAQLVFVGPSTGLRGPRRVVQVLRNHDDHIHVRLPRRR